FGECFNQPITEALWPASLRHLVFSRDFRLPSENFEWPASLQRVTIACRPDQALPSWQGVQVFGVWRVYWPHRGGNC
ncbi:unnamed protein product, partial [Ectocarpus fasciculatus]